MNIMTITSNIQKTSTSIMRTTIKRITRYQKTYWFTDTMYGGFFCMFMKPMYIKVNQLRFNAYYLYN